MLACTDSVGLDRMGTVAGLFHSAVKQYVTNATHITISVSAMLWRCGMRGARCEDVGCGIAFRGEQKISPSKVYRCGESWQFMLLMSVPPARLILSVFYFQNTAN